MSYQPPPNGFRTFVIVWVTQSVSVIGSALTFFATTIWLTEALYPRPEQKPLLALALSAVSLAFMLPMVFLAPLAGAWTDRHDRRQTMIAADLVSGGLVLVMAVLIAAGRLELWSLMGIVAASSLAGTFHSSAFDTSYAMLVPDRLLPRANGMMQTIWSLSGIVSPALAAGLIALPALARQGLIPGAAGGALARLNDGTALALLVDGVTFFLSAGVLLLVQIPSPARTDLDGAAGRVRTSIWADVREGARFIWRRRPLLWLLGAFAAANLLSSPTRLLTPLIVRFDLTADMAARGFTFETALALLNTAGSLGGVAGGLLISAWGGLRARRVYGVLIPMLVGGLFQIAFGLSGLIYLTAAMAAVTSGMIPIMNAHSQAIWQSQTPHQLQGRVFAVRRVIAQCTLPVATALGGWAGGRFNPGAVLAALGGLMVLFCTAQLFNRQLLLVEDGQLPDHAAAGMP